MKNDAYDDQEKMEIKIGKADGTDKPRRLTVQGTLTPAYGRDYKSKDSAIKDFRGGKDFAYNLMGKSTYCSIRDFKEGDLIKIRYAGGWEATFYRIVGGDLS